MFNSADMGVLAYVGGMGAASTLAVVVGLLLFRPALFRTPVRSVQEMIRYDSAYLGFAWLVTVTVNELAFQFHSSTLDTHRVYAVEGTIVEQFQTLATPLLTLVCSVVYLVAFPTLLILTYFVVKAQCPVRARRYTVAYATLVGASAPLFLVFPVEIPGLYLEGVDPLLFNVHPYIEQGLLATDTMVKAFPSLHTGLSVLAALYARHTPARYRYTAWVVTGTIVVSTFYLGIHWLSDAIAGAALAYVVYRLTRDITPPELDRVYRLLPRPTSHAE